MIYPEYLQSEQKTLQPTPSDIEGPFYKEGAPFVIGLSSLPTLTVHGLVLDTNGKPVPNAVLDVWHANEQGIYDNEGYNYRGRFVADGEGRYRIDTIRPGNYQISEGESRCAHLHLKVSGLDVRPLTTQLYFRDDPHNKTDRWFDISRVIGDCGEFTFVLEALNKPSLLVR